MKPISEEELTKAAGIIAIHTSYTLTEAKQILREAVQRFEEEHKQREPKVGEYWNVFIDQPGYYEDKGIVMIVKTEGDDYILPKGCFWTVDTKGSECSYHVKWFKRPATPEEVEQYKKDSLIAEAKRRYKDGDRVKCLISGRVYVVKIDTLHCFALGVWCTDNGQDVKIGSRRCNEWAEVVEEKEELSREQELEQALKEARSLIRTSKHNANGPEWLYKLQNEAIKNIGELLNKKP